MIDPLVGFDIVHKVCADPAAKTPVTAAGSTGSLVPGQAPFDLASKAVASGAGSL